MSVINIDDLVNIQSSQSDNNNNNNPVTPHPLANAVQINTGAIESTLQPPLVVSSLNENSDIVPVVIFSNRRMNSPLSVSNILEIREHKLWSVLSSIFCCLFIGIFAIHMSCMTRRAKHLGNVIKARELSKLTVLMNIVAMTSGLLICIVTALRYTGNILP